MATLVIGSLTWIGVSSLTVSVIVWRTDPRRPAPHTPSPRSLYARSLRMLEPPAIDGVREASGYSAI